jgi:hypothetical protein
MTMATSAQGAKADAETKATAADAAVEKSDSGVTVQRPGTTDYEPTKLYHRDGREATANSIDREVALVFDGFSKDKPKSR